MGENRFLDEAIAIARSGSSDGLHGPFGAVVAREGKVIARGCNSVVAGADPTAHAEVVAIREAAARLGTHDLSGCTIYCSCEPCPMCLGAIHWARIDEIVYAADRSDAARAGFDNELLYSEVAAPPGGRTVPMRRARADEGRMVLDAWLENPDRVSY